MKHMNLMIVLGVIALTFSLMFFIMERNHFIFSFLAIGIISVVSLFWWAENLH